jgi:hypothetical protein
MNKARIGIYGSLPRDTEVFNIVTSILGYDPFHIQEVQQDSIISQVCGRAKTFGCHFTIYDFFTPTNYDLVIDRLKQIVKNVQPFEFTFTDFSGYVRGDYQGKPVYNNTSKTVLALDFDRDTQKKLLKIHTDIITDIQEFRQKIEPEFDKGIFKNIPELWALIQKYGSPYVLNNYSPHLSLASNLDGTEEVLKTLIEYLNTNYGDQLLNHKIPFDRIYIFEEIVEGKYTGYFKIKDEILLN